MARTSFAQLMDNLADLETVPSRVATEYANDLNKLLQDEFSGEHDPYGEPWARNAPSTIKKKGFDRPMFETGETMRETRAYPLPGAGVQITSTEKAGYNMFERDNVPARAVLPAREELPPAWVEALKERIAKEFAKKRGRR
jgi:hypothetical protein